MRIAKIASVGGKSVGGESFKRRANPVAER